MGKYMSIDKSNGKFKVKKAGYFRITAWAMQHSNLGSRYVRLLVNGETRFRSRYDGQYWMTNHVNELMKLQPGDTFQVQYFTTGSNLYNWHAGLHSSLYVQYEGGHVPLFDGGCTKPVNGKKSAYCLDSIKSNNMQDYVSYVAKNGRVTIKKDGYYRINMFVNMKNPGHMYFTMATAEYGAVKEYNYDDRTDASWWGIAKRNQMYLLKKGDYFYFENIGAQVGGFNEDGSQSQSRLQISYEGPSKKLYQGYCSKRKNSGWQKYCLDKSMHNTLGGYMHIGEDGTVKALKSGMYKFEWEGIQFTGANNWKHFRLMVRGATYDYDHNKGKGWLSNSHVAVVPMKAGDTAYSYPYVNSGHAFHEGKAYGHMQISYEEPLNLYEFSNGLSRHKNEFKSINVMLSSLEKKLKNELKNAESDDKSRTRVRMKVMQAADDAEKEQVRDDSQLEELKARVERELELIAGIRKVVAKGSMN